MSAPWTFRYAWPVEDDQAGYAEARAFAEAELAQVVEEAGVRLVGPVEWEMVDNEQPSPWPDADLVLTAVAEALPVLATRDQFVAAVKHYAGLGLNDGDIGEVMGRPRNAVVHIRRTHRIPPGVPPGYRSRAQIGEPRWPAA